MCTLYAQKHMQSVVGALQNLPLFGYSQEKIILNKKKSPVFTALFSQHLSSGFNGYRWQACCPRGLLELSLSS